MLTDRSDVIVLTDDAHRSQCNTLALNMRAALPRAMFLAFTGTPLIAGEERTPELQLINPDLNDDIHDLIERAALDADQEQKLETVLDEKFRDTGDPLRLVFVCAMWLTGFDAPSCSTVYLDKPMRSHSLMQTIARANRVFPSKHSGVIVDYANVLASLEKRWPSMAPGRGHAPGQGQGVAGGRAA